MKATEAFFSWLCSILERALGVQPGQISIPITVPRVPVFLAAGSREDPVPHPASNNLAPGKMAAFSTNLAPK
jgi:hypothetical protein